MPRGWSKILKDKYKHTDSKLGRWNTTDYQSRPSSHWDLPVPVGLEPLLGSSSSQTQAANPAEPAQHDEHDKPKQPASEGAR